MTAVAGLCVILAGVMLAALFAPPGVMAGIHGAFWFLAKVGAYLYAFLWFRFTFPRYRFDQLMRLGWRFLIPLALVNVIGAGTAIVLSEEWGLHPFPSAMITSVATLAVAVWLASDGAKQTTTPQPASGD